MRCAGSPANWVSAAYRCLCFTKATSRLRRAPFSRSPNSPRGAYLRFNLASADRLKDLLAAVAVYAAGGYRALSDYSGKKGGEVLRLTSQLRG